jgi:Zn-dependent peptidase ImmA (M78 family)
VWGIAYNGKSRPERQRFTIAHELGHFILHRAQRQRFNCDKQSVHTGIETLRDIEREADDFASNLLMPGDLLRDWIANQRIDFGVLGDIAQRFQVSLEALCIRYIKFTPERAILVLLGQRLHEVRVAQQQREENAGAHLAQRRAGGTHAGHAGR